MRLMNVLRDFIWNRRLNMSNTVKWVLVAIALWAPTVSNAAAIWVEVVKAPL